MDKRTAKREALWIAGGFVRGCLNGYDWDERYPDDEETALKVNEQMYAVIAELESRGHR